MEKPDPGSHQALMDGCTCPVQMNNFGLGTEKSGELVFFVDAECPVHGTEDVLMAEDAGTVH
jgi:hypothetical protein